ncbi:MAG: hypothetical protein JST00_05205 [Deltaproteobacteria bacterium]|nr:hypothetical protein [Deltaproteobacteria bacterium]
MRSPLRSKLSLVALSLLALGSIAAAPGCAAPTEEAGNETDPDVSEDNVKVSADANRLLDVPFYFGVPKSAVTTEINRRAYSYPTVWQSSVEVKDVGLRMIAVKQAGTTPPAKKAARLDMAKQLAKAGVLQDGDIALSFRPELGGTMAYPHIQMGSTHASLVYTKNGEAFNVDSPLDDEYVGQFSTKHFVGGTSSTGVDLGTDALHILRPVGFDDARRARMQKWAATVAQNRAYGKVRFQKDYLTPIFASQRMTTKQTITELGKIILNVPGARELPMYCSEFAWHMLALSNCSEQEIRSAGPEGAACVAPVFEPMQLAAKDAQSVGLAEGPLVNVMAAPAEARGGLVKMIFETGQGAGRLSSGHRAVAEQVAPLMAGLSQYYGARAQGATADMTAQAATGLNAGVQNVPNYSPTAYLVSSMQPEGLRKMSYIATVVFVDGDADMEKAKRLSMPAGSSVPR